MVKYKHPEARRPDIDRHVAQRVRERRVILGLSQQQLAQRIGLSFQQIHKYENGINRIAAGVLERIARTLGVGPEFFYEGLGEARAQSDRPRALLSLAQDFTRLDTAQQHASLNLSRALAGTDTEDATGLDKTA
jgi:transcriptional regulator with XRE-family HTH domain